LSFTRLRGPVLTNSASNRAAAGITFISPGIPNFVAEIIKSGLYRTSEKRYSFNDIFEILEQNNFQVEDGVDSKGVSTFVSWVESAEHLDQ
jgi:hypothetical protein